MFHHTLKRKRQRPLVDVIVRDCFPLSTALLSKDVGTAAGGLACVEDVDVHLTLSEQVAPDLVAEQDLSSVQRLAHVAVSDDNLCGVQHKASSLVVGSQRREVGVSPDSKQTDADPH